jgi:hypothetical protein
VVGEADRVGDASSKFAIAGFQDALEISINLAVPAAEHFESLTHEVFASLSVTCRICVEIMLTAVNLNNQASP